MMKRQLLTALELMPLMAFAAAEEVDAVVWKYFICGGNAEGSGGWSTARQ